MRKAPKAILILTIIISSYNWTSGQELRNLINNYKVGKAVEDIKVDPQPDLQYNLLTLPFFEDFSDYGPLPLQYPFPKASKWSDRFAYINSEYADSMISIGVATLDAINDKGRTYPAEIAENGYSDYLTSNYFSIDENNHTPLYLSFFYQAGGKGDVPEEKDSLLVDIYTLKNKWVNVWAIPGGTEQHSFAFVYFQVPDSLVKDSLRFRFKNRTSNFNENPNKESNADQWHIDYIRLNRTNAPDTLKDLNDATIMAPLLPAFIEYCAVPYGHLDLVRGTLERGNNPLMIRTSFPEIPDLLRIERTHISIDISNNQIINIIGDLEGIASDMLPVETNTITDYFSTRFSKTANNKIGHFEIKSYINVPGIDQNTINDTVTRTELFTDYYAHDDGSAEFGFGISGESQGQVYIAERFRIFRKSDNPDTLKAVYILFNQTNDPNHSLLTFNLCVWKNNGAQPGELIYESEATYNPDDSIQYLSDFTRIELETPLLVSDTIFVGIKQDELGDFINIGYDVNTNSLSSLYLKTSLNDWYNPSSFLPGSLMIRPSFGEEYPWVENPQIISKPAITAYPNPASDQLNFIFPPELASENVRIRVIDILGTTVMDLFSDQKSIDISGLRPGFYVAVISIESGSNFSTVKFIKK